MTKQRPTWIRMLVAAIVLAMTLATAAVAVTAYTWTIARVDTVGRVDFEKPLQLPPLAASTVGPDGVRSFDLDMQSGTSDLGHGPDTETWGVNGSYLGPTIRAKRGERVRMNVSNRLGVTSTLHWHGMHLPAAMDGGPHQLVEPGTTWSPQWTVDQPAATLWYHPHMHGETADHVYRGIAGMFLIDDANGPALPDRYGVDDIPVIVQDKKFNGERLDASSAIFNDTGVLGDEIMVNGTPGPYLDVTTERVRLRLLNASNARVYNFGFSDDQDFQLIGTDGGLLAKPVAMQNLRLSPGERAEIVVALSPDTTTVLRSTPPHLGAGFWNDRFAGGADSFDILQLRAASTLTSNAVVPETLSTLPDLGDPTVTRRFDLTSSTSLNNKSMDTNRIDEVVTVGTTEVWEVHNSSGQVHNFHVHDVQFQVLDTDDPSLAGRKDTVYIAPNETRRLLMRFTDFTDPSMPYMFHCHLLRHEDQGLMGQFVVVAPGETAASSAPHHAGHG